MEEDDAPHRSSHEASTTAPPATALPTASEPSHGSVPITTTVPPTATTLSSSEPPVDEQSPQRPPSHPPSLPQPPPWPSPTSPDEDEGVSADSPIDIPWWTRVGQTFSNLISSASEPFRNYDRSDASGNPLSRLSPSSSANAGGGNGRRPKGGGGEGGGPIWFLGVQYPSIASSEFVEDFQSRLWLTYRHSYPPIKPSQYTSDVGWGCMLRSGQMILASGFVFHYLGRGWRRSHNTEDPTILKTYSKIVSWFLDTSAAPFSIHRIALLGKQFDKDIGQWFGPSTIAQVLRALVNNQSEVQLTLQVATDGVIYKDDVRKHCLSCDEDGGWKSVLILVPLRLGVDQLNPIYIPALRACFEFPQCVGIAGGRPNSSLFFVGVEGEHNLIYLDPHFLRQTLDAKPNDTLAPSDLATFHCDTVRLVPINTLDPSLVIGFYVRDEASFDDFCARVRKISQGRSPMFTVGDTRPVYADEDDVVLSDAEFELC